MLKLTEVKNPHIHVFGAGGTGGFALEYLTRLFAESEQRVTIDIYDGDDVELKNLKRQNFTVNDLSKNKVTALVGRLSQQVPEPPTFIEHTEYIISEDELTAEVLMNTEDDETLIFILAVDNIATRRLINTVIDELTGIKPIIALDSGNDNQGGQVVIYSNEPAQRINLLGKETAITLPTMLKLFPEIDIIKDDRDENPGLVSYCAEESESKPQAMMANVNNGQLLALLTYQIAQNQTVAYNIWRTDILTGEVRGDLLLTEGE